MFCGETVKKLLEMCGARMDCYHFQPTQLRPWQRVPTIELLRRQNKVTLKEYQEVKCL